MINYSHQHTNSIKKFPYKVISTIFSARDLSRNNNIVVCKPDQGIGVVVVDNDRYVESIQSIISDLSKLQEITLPIHKYVTKIEDKINNFIRNFKSSKLLSDEYFKQLFTSGSGPGVLYGLPKIHKPNFAANFQFRPIFSPYNTPSFNLLKFLVPILNTITVNEFTTNNFY